MQRVEASGDAGGSPWRRALYAARDILVVAPGTASGTAARITFSAVVALGAAPWLGWPVPASWLAAMVAFALAERATGNRADKDLGRPGWGRFLPRNLYSWLISAGYAVAAFYLTFTQSGAAQTLGVTLFGVVMFTILARDYSRPRRLATNLSPMVLSILTVQVGAAWFMVLENRPWQILTLLATIYLVYRAFRSVQIDLTLARGRLAEASTRAEADARDLREAHRIAQMAEAMAGVGHWRMDLATRRFTWSEGVFRIYGLEPSDTPPDVEAQMAFYDEDMREDLLGRLRAAAADGKPFELDGRMTRVDGERRYVVCHGAAELRADGSVERLFGTFMDVTEARIREAALLDAKLRAEAAVEAKADFLANMSHEIRTPLTAINGYAGLLANTDGLPPEARTWVGRVSTAGQALMAVVNDILDFSRLEAGQVVADPRPFAAAPLLGDLVAMFAEQAQAKGLALSLEVSPDVPAVLSADSARLGQVIANLVGNALKFTETGEVRVTADWSPTDERLRIAVADTGCGVPEDKRALLFQRFSQVDGSISRRHGGTGLGLSICKGLVTLLGGSIGMEPRAGGGSVFRFEIPAPAATAERPDAVDDTLPAPDAAVARILVVDDLEVNRELVRTMLRAIGHEVVEADGGAAAVRLAADQPFDLILMDLQMPGMDGFASARAIRALPGRDGAGNHETPIIALSADVLPEHIDATARAGMNGHIGKPISPVELIGAVGRWAGVRIAA